MTPSAWFWLSLHILYKSGSDILCIDCTVPYDSGYDVHVVYESGSDVLYRNSPSLLVIFSTHKSIESIETGCYVLYIKYSVLYKSDSHILYTHLT
jgi:hypothetical protein